MRKKTTETIFIIISVMTLVSVASAEVKVAGVFTDNMVLQRELPVPVWGTASAGEKIAVSFNGQKVKTTADDKGNWMVKLKSLKTSKTEKTMTVKGSNTITLSGILVGEVWLCSGQSNMAGKFVAAKDRMLDPKAFEKDHSGFRFQAKNGSWQYMKPETQRLCSRVGYYFGMNLYEELNIPVGLIMRASSSTPIQSWMSASSAEEVRKELDIPKHWGNPKNPDTPATQYDEWIEDIIPVSFRGVIWYQGERNAKSQTGWEYRHLLPQLINSWRQTWADRSQTPLHKFSFYYIQVPCQGGEGTEWPWLRDGMRRAVDMVDNAGMAVYYDHGPNTHPENKQVAGERLALLAMAKDYGRRNLVHCGPLLDKVTIKKDKAVLSFKHIGSGLKSKSGEKNLKFFEIAGKDAKYASAKAWIQ
ncbi:MAG: hypothetical protein KAR47_11970, partial [Planctomycetes bacterium]|nr:hypothetical protein [Planctomycetota bacterium]